MSLFYGEASDSDVQTHVTTMVSLVGGAQGSIAKVYIPDLLDLCLVGYLFDLSFGVLGRLVHSFGCFIYRGSTVRYRATIVSEGTGGARAGTRSAVIGQRTRGEDKPEGKRRALRGPGHSTFGIGTRLGKMGKFESEHR
jgi:hypothetical protein